MTLYVLAIACGLAFSFGVTLAFASWRSAPLADVGATSPIGRNLAPSAAGGGIEVGGPIELAPLVITSEARARASPPGVEATDDARPAALGAWRRCSAWQPLLMGSGEVRLCE